MLIAVERLREISEACRSGEPLDEDLARWLGACLSRFLDRAVVTFEEAFDLPSCHGGLPWWKEDRIRRRDSALRDLAACLPEGLSLTARAREISRITVRYAASAWRRDALLDRMPDAYAGTLREPVWLAFRSGAPMPLGERQLRNIIG